MSKAKQLTDALAVLEAERVALQIQLRSELMRAAKELLPIAVHQARGIAKPCPACGWAGRSSPALLRLIARLGLRDASIDKRR